MGCTHLQHYCLVCCHPLRAALNAMLTEMQGGAMTYLLATADETLQRICLQH